MSDSLLSPTDNQLLLSVDSGDRDIPSTDPGVVSNDHTASTLHARHPDRYLAIVCLLASGCGQLRTARHVGCSVHTVRAVAEREKAAIGDERKQIVSRSLSLAAMLQETMEERLACKKMRDEIPFRDLAVAMGISVDQSIKLSGGPTLTIRHEIVRPAADAWDDEMGCGGGNSLQKVEGSVTLRGEVVEDRGSVPGAGDGGQFDGPGSVPGVAKRDATDMYQLRKEGEDQ